MIHLAVFGFLGVFTRYGLQKLFGPDCLALTSDQSPLYPDLPSNMLGSFLMGWFGIIFKADIRNISDHLIIGITDGHAVNIPRPDGEVEAGRTPGNEGSGR
jgi:CrcB protein